MQRSIIPSNQDLTILQGVTSLVLFVKAKVKEIARLGRQFSWPKPLFCPRCSGKLWGHGFVLSYFSSVHEGIYLRRLRCSCCGAVHRVRPYGYFRRFRSSIAEILACILYRNRKKRWLPGLPRRRQRLWWRSLRRMIKLILGMNFQGDEPQGYQLIITQNIIPVTRATQKENMTVQ